jgi:hypothetical protein
MPPPAAERHGLIAPAERWSSMPIGLDGTV